MNGKLRFSPQVTALIVLIWLIGLIGIYFVGQNRRELFHAGLLFFVDLIARPPLTPPFWHLCGDRLIDVATTVLLLLSAWCLGFFLLRRFRLIDRPDTVSHLLAAAVGLGLWSWWVLFTGLAGYIGASWYLLPALFSLLLGIAHWPLMRKEWQQSQATPPEPWNGLEVCLIVVLIAGFVLNLVPAFSPEVEYDTLEYHLGALKEYQKAGRIHFLPHNFYASMPSLTEMLYLWGITLRSSTVAKLIHGTFACMTAAALIGFGRRLHNRQLGLTAAALFYTLPYVTSLADTARIDLATTFFAFLAGAALHRYLFDGETNFLWLSSFAAGLTLATKYTAGPVVLLPLTMILIRYRHSLARDSEPHAPRSPLPASRFLLLAVVPVLPWLIKNALFTRNPFYPIANGIFHSPYWDAVCAGRFQEHHAPGFATWGAWASLFTAFWTRSAQESFSSPILFFFAPLFALLAKPNARWKFCAWMGLLIYVCWWGFTFRPWRFLFPALPWFALLGAMALVSMEGQRATALLLRSTLGLMLLFNLNYSFILNAVDLNDPERIPPRINKLSVFFGRATPTEYLANTYFTLGWIGRNLPPDACVLFVGEARTYYTPQRVLANTVYDTSIIGEMVGRSKTPADLLEEMKKAGVTHIYVNQDELDRLQRNYQYLRGMNWPLFHEFLKTYTRTLLRNNAHAVYAIERKNGGEE